MSRDEWVASRNIAPEDLEPDKPKVKLVGENGNVFNVIGRCTKALKRAGYKERAAEFSERAFNGDSYDEVLQLAMEYCEVE